MHPKQMERLERIEEIGKYIERNQPISLIRLRHVFVYIAPRTFKEYMEALKFQGKIETDQDGMFKAK